MRPTVKILPFINRGTIQFELNKIIINSLRTVYGPLARCNWNAARFFTSFVKKRTSYKIKCPLISSK